MTRTALLAAITLLVPGALTAQAGRKQTEEGNRLYQEQQYDKAHEKYLDALRRAPESDIIRFNDGAALYQGKEYQRALEAFRSAAESEDPTLQAKAWYNLGNALYRQQQLDSAVAAYKQALRLAPDDVDAKYNLERALLQKQQQQQQQNDQQQNDQQQNDQQQNDQQQNDQQKNDQQQQQQQAQPQPGQMSKEDVERLLRAVREDQSKIQRQQAATSARRRPAKDW